MIPGAGERRPLRCCPDPTWCLEWTTRSTLEVCEPYSSLSVSLSLSPTLFPCLSPCLSLSLSLSLFLFLLLSLSFFLYCLSFLFFRSLYFFLIRSLYLYFFLYLFSLSLIPNASRIYPIISTTYDHFPSLTHKALLVIPTNKLKQFTQLLLKKETKRN